MYVVIGYCIMVKNLLMCVVLQKESAGCYLSAKLI